jgi:DNA-binding transcriptional MocR family regulator
MTSWTPTLQGRDGPLYRLIADSLAADIEEGRLPPGTRLPTHRELAERVGVTVGTVTRAYAEAERRGLIGGEVGRGTYVRHREATRPLPSIAPQPVGDESLIEMGLNWPATPEVDPAAQALRRTMEELSRSTELSELIAYQPQAGLLAHRAAGAAWISRFGVTVQPEQVVICSGGQHAMEVALKAVTRPGDTVLTEALTYPGMKALASQLHLRVQGVAMDEHGLLPEALEAACRGGAKLLYCVPNLQNPTSAVLPRERRERIAAIVRAQGLTLLEDDPYGLLLEDRPEPLSALVPESSYFIAGVSKLLAPGLRIGYLAGPRGGASRLAESAGLATRLTPPLTAEICARWITDGTAEELVKSRRREARERLELARAALGEEALRSARDLTFHLWMELPAHWRSEAFVAQARRQGVSVTPSEVFSVGAAAPGAVRVCLGAPRTQALLRKGLQRLRDTLTSGPAPLASIV